MSHRNSKKSNRIGQSIQKYRAQHSNPFEAEACAAMDREYRSKLPNHPEPLAQRTPDAELPASTSSLCHSVTSPLPTEAAAPAAEISNLKSPTDSTSTAPFAPLPLCPSTPSELAAARDLIASKPATKAMHKLQALLDNHEVDFLNPDQVAQFSTLLNVYAKLQNSAAVEHIMEALVQVGAGYKREPLTRELAKVLSVQDRALARAQRELAAKVREQRRIEREAKQQQAQIAKQAREERLFNQREDHLVRKEKIAQTELDTALYNRANLLRETVNKYDKSQGAKQSHSSTPSAPASLDPSAPSCSQDATPAT